MKNFKTWGAKRRLMPEYNYNALWYDLKTIRFGLGVAKELPPERAEFFDIGINTKCNSKCSWCFSKGTPIKTANGDIPIENIKIGDSVYSYNLEKKDIELKTVDQIHKSLSQKILKIELESGEIIRVTPNHKLYTKNRGWVEAESLTEEDELLEYE